MDVSKTISTIKKDRYRLFAYFAFVVLIAGASCISYQYVLQSKERIPYFYDVILDQTNGLIDICIVLPFAWLLANGSIKAFYKNEFKTNAMILSILANGIVCLLLFVIVNFVVYLIFSGFANPFMNRWGSSNSIREMGYTPLSASICSLILFYVRMTFFTILSYSINISMSSEISGFLVVLIICIMDWGLYEWLKILEPLGLLPVEHSRIVYTGGYAPLTGSEHRISFIATFIYWSILYSIGLFTLFRSKKGTGALNDWYIKK